MKLSKSKVSDCPSDVCEGRGAGTIFIFGMECDILSNRETIDLAAAMLSMATSLQASTIDFACKGTSSYSSLIYERSIIASREKTAMEP